jgi:hypothetical protein
VRESEGSESTEHDPVELSWGRSVPLPEVTPEFLEEHLADWPDLASREWGVLGGGLRSLNLRSGELVLRIALEGDALQKEAALLRWLEPQIRVPRLLRSSERALLMEHVPHAPLPATEEAGRRVGAAIARIQSRTFDRAGMLGPDLRVVEPFVTGLSGLRDWAERLLEGAAGARLGPERGRALRRLWDAHEGAMVAASSQPVLVHSDFKPTNVKWLPTEQDVLVLDWEFAWSGPALFDLGMMFRWEPPELFVEGVLASLHDAGIDAGPNARRLAELFDVFNLVGFLGDERDRPKRYRDVLDRVDRTLAAR